MTEITHDLSRRTVLGAGATALAAGAVTVATPATAPAAAQASYTRSAGLYRRSRWSARRGRTFLVTAPGVRARMTLTAVRNIPNVARGSERSFELVFRASVRGPDQGTYDVRRTRFSRTSLFLVPADEERRTYRATINNR